MTKIIAEVGSNWETFDHAKDSIAVAAKCGASAVKFQAYTHEALYGHADPWTHEGAQTLEQRRHIRRELPLEWLPKLAEKAKACGIEFMCTAFSPALVAAVDPYVSTHKIASSDNGTPEMLAAVKATRKPVIISCGASSKGDIAGMLDGVTIDGRVAWEGFPKDYPLTLLYCAAAYPSRRHNLYLIDELRAMFGRPVGLSDHSTDAIYTPLAAVRTHGATVIEKHFTIIPDADTPDRAHSLNPDQFKLMVDYIRGKRDGGGYNPTSEEQHMFLRNNRRLVATRDIAQGEELRYADNFGSFRSLKDDVRGFTPFMWREVTGKAATKAIARGEAIGPGDFA